MTETILATLARLAQTLGLVPDLPRLDIVLTEPEVREDLGFGRRSAFPPAGRKPSMARAA